MQPRADVDVNNISMHYPTVMCLPQNLERIISEQKALLIGYYLMPILRLNAIRLVSYVTLTQCSLLYQSLLLQAYGGLMSLWINVLDGQIQNCFQQRAFVLAVKLLLALHGGIF